jgi:hypothetical protein
MAANPNFAKKYNPPVGRWRFFEANSSQFGFASGGHTFAGGGVKTRGNIENSVKWL